MERKVIHVDFNKKDVTRVDSTKLSRSEVWKEKLRRRRKISEEMREGERSWFDWFLLVMMTLSIVFAVSLFL